ncbi:comF family protein [Terriglobus roseus]|uniref:ComF family protein n=1 Tax=Terriglobus roseus TaxID=392734 RepID=A0A1H4MAX2_9BACT|nr:comF family protein [Terriglobus roseus]
MGLVTDKRTTLHRSKSRTSGDSANGAFVATRGGIYCGQSIFFTALDAIAPAAGTHGWSRVRCVFPTASWAVAESGAVAAGLRSSCAPESRHPLFSLPQHFVNSIISLLAPGNCRLCHASLNRAVDYPVCDHCTDWFAASVLSGVCSLCCEPLGFESVAAADLSRSATSLCAACKTQPPKFTRAVAFGLYDDLRPAIRLMKFEGVPALARPLGFLLAEAILSLRVDAPEAMTVVPVPLFRGKRRYNQSVLLAQSALKRVHLTAPGWRLRLAQGILVRSRKTDSQFSLTPAQRRENVRGAFAVRGDVNGQDILLVDDVYTTGATAAECTRVLLKAGAQSVRVATLARAGRDIAVRWQPPPEIAARAGPQMNLPKPF